MDSAPSVTATAAATDSCPSPNRGRLSSIKFLGLWRQRSSSAANHGYHPQIPNKPKGTAKDASAAEPHRLEVRLRESSGSFRHVREGLSRMSWYWGNVTGMEAANILQEMPDHSFLVRDSSDSRSLFAITYRTTGGAIGSTRLQFRAGKFFLCYGNETMPSFSNVVDLIHHCMEVSKQRPVFGVRIRSRDYHVHLLYPLTRNEPLSLQEACRKTVHKYFPRELLEGDNNGLPPRMRDFLLECPFRPADGSKIGPRSVEPAETAL